MHLRGRGFVFQEGREQRPPAFGVRSSLHVFDDFTRAGCGVSVVLLALCLPQLLKSRRWSCSICSIGASSLSAGRSPLCTFHCLRLLWPLDPPKPHFPLNMLKSLIVGMKITVTL